MKLSKDDLQTLKAAIEYSLAASGDEIHDSKCAILYSKICGEIVRREQS